MAKKYVRVNDDNKAHLRERMDRTSNSITRLNPGYELEILDTHEVNGKTWYAVATVTGIEGYIHESAVHEFS